MQGPASNTTAAVVITQPRLLLVPGVVGVLICWTVCVMPLLFGFFIPVGVLISLVATNDFIADFLAIREIIVNTLTMASVAASDYGFVIFYCRHSNICCGSITRKLALFASTDTLSRELLWLLGC